MSRTELLRVIRSPVIARSTATVPQLISNGPPTPDPGLPVLRRALTWYHKFRQLPLPIWSREWHRVTLKYP